MCMKSGDATQVPRFSLHEETLCVRMPQSDEYMCALMCEGRMCGACEEQSWGEMGWSTRDWWDGARGSEGWWYRRS